ncbi:helix-turn-helix domain-containing protein [Roseomonas sp. ACRSG]|nr:helix-turn-helix domain-containing protein [Roseomonas sp. ACRSG]
MKNQGQLSRQSQELLGPGGVVTDSSRMVRPVGTTGVAAGLDLALALVEEDLGAELARQVAAQLVMFFKRGGGQMQFNRHGVSAPVSCSALQEVKRWPAAHPAEDHSVDRLSARTGMSPRHFARLFWAETGLTLAVYAKGARTEAARGHLKSGDIAMKQIAGALSSGGSGQRQWSTSAVIVAAPPKRPGRHRM